MDLVVIVRVPLIWVLSSYYCWEYQLLANRFQGVRTLDQNGLSVIRKNLLLAYSFLEMSILLIIEYQRKLLIRCYLKSDTQPSYAVC